MIPAVSGQTAGVEGGNLQIIEADRARGGVVQAAKNVQEGGLATARRSQQNHQFTYPQIKINAPQGADFRLAGAVNLGQAPNGKRRR